MNYGLYQSAAGMMTNEYRQNVLANNIANADTAGFKRDVATFAERLRASQAGRRSGPSNELFETMSGGVWLGRTYTDYSEGSFQPTGNPTDVALAGPGFLMVDLDGTPHLTRDGRMILTESGMLVSATDGAPILSEGGAPIRVNPRGGELSIDEDGRIRQGGGTVGRLAVVDVPDLDALRKVGGGRFALGEMETIRSAARVISKHIESSGVQPIKELVTMMEASRAYQLNAQMVTLQDQSIGRLIGSIGLR